MGSPTHTSSPASPSSHPPVKPNPFRPIAVWATVLGAIGTGATIVGGGILLSFHLLTVDDEHTRRAAGISTVVVGAVMIPPTLIIGAYDAYRYWKWRQWMKAHAHQTNGVAEANSAPHAPAASSQAASHSATETTLHEPHTTSYDYPDDEQPHAAATSLQPTQPIRPIQIVTAP